MTVPSAAELANAVARLRPQDSPSEHLRLALLLSGLCPTIEQAEDAGWIGKQVSDISHRLAAATDQHATMTSEIESLATTGPCEFQPQHIWTLVRALKVQGQILNLYIA